MKKLLRILACVFLFGAPLTVKILKNSWAQPMDIHEYATGKTRQLSVDEKILIYCYAIFGPIGLLIALIS
ncbi:MAG: hypothetical protein US76_03465 [Parcubacteria group bacterium GW2011_GWA2_38_13b]|nr:MAG: hypothetical protein US76_03465 [Parcubacteria group bacterium GW2011_GWA2_38_13b]